jgi:hypothetical protein
VSQSLCAAPILGLIFLAKTHLVLDVTKYRCYLAFAPTVVIKRVCAGAAKLQFQSVVIEGEAQRQITSLNLTPPRRHVLLQLFQKYSDVLTSHLKLTRLIEHSVQMKDLKPVRLALYRSSPRKVKSLLEYLQG